MNSQEREKKLIRDTTEQLQADIEIKHDRKDEPDVVDLELKKKMKEQSRKSNAIMSRYISEKSREVEESAIKRIECIFYNKYIVMNNMRIGSVEFDVILKSKTDELDYIIEIKYLFSALSWNASAWSRNLNSLIERERLYRKETNRNVSMVLLIVTEEDERDKLEQLCARKLESVNAIVIVFSTNEINQLNFDDIVA
jgi:hypothetical protein